MPAKEHPDYGAERLGGTTLIAYMKLAAAQEWLVCLSAGVSRQLWATDAIVCCYQKQCYAIESMRQLEARTMKTRKVAMYKVFMLLNKRGNRRSVSTTRNLLMLLLYCESRLRLTARAFTCVVLGGRALRGSRDIGSDAHEAVGLSGALLEASKKRKT